MYMIVNLNVHVEIVHYEGRQGSNMRPRASFFLSQRNYIFWGERFCEIFSDKTPAKDLRKIIFCAKDLRKHVFIREEWHWPFADNEFGSTAIQYIE